MTLPDEAGAAGCGAAYPAGEMRRRPAIPETMTPW
jgi:hypothetical protein